ncbi:MAG TPA: glycosyltransferase [Chthoniobacterales bacterium]|nr:glycosyltransferase [Chthoniobacterales bacterium]
MKISAVICTRNRAAHLLQAIQSLRDQDIGSGNYEIVVVDNASSDETANIVKPLAAEMPAVRYVFEKTPGLTNARNRGVRDARAPMIAFLDDDALAGPAWLSSIVSAFEQFPDAMCVGGPIEPWFETPAPAWFPARLLGCYNRSYGPEARWYNFPHEQPVGCNMAFRKRCLEEIGGFNPLLTKYNDETELIGRMVNAGGKLFYQPAAVVKHLLPRERLTLTWQIRRHYHEGVSLAVAAGSNSPVPRMRRIKELGGNLLRIGKRFARLALSRGSIERVEKLTDVSVLVGKTVYLTKSLRHP